MNISQPSSGSLPGQSAPKEWRARLMGWLLIGALLLGLLSLVPSLLPSIGLLPVIFVFLIYAGLGFLAWQRAPYWLQFAGFALIVYALGLAELLGPHGAAGAAVYFLGLILFAAMLWTRRAGIIGGALAAVTLVAVGILRPATFAAAPSSFIDWIGPLAAILIFGAGLLEGLRQMRLEFAEAEKRIAVTQQELERERGALEQRVSARAVQLRTVLDVSQSASAILDPEQLIERVVRLISDRLEYYYAAVFLLNEHGDWAELHSATGEAGRVLKENKHRLRVGGTSMVGTAISTRQARIALDTGAEPVRFDNPLLPYTRSEIALPLVVGDRVLGALDVQSTKPGAFGPNDIDTLQGLANQIAITFENARLFQDSRRSLEELQSVQRQYVMDSWGPMGGREDMEYTVGEDEPAPESAQMEVPLSLRDEIIGAINLSGESDWTPEQRNLIEAVAVQASLALENARLVEASQSAARREHTLAEITGRVWGSNSMEGILRTALSELGQALDADEAFIELKVDQSHD